MITLIFHPIWGFVQQFLRRGQRRIWQYVNKSINVMSQCHFFFYIITYKGMAIFGSEHRIFSQWNLNIPFNAVALCLSGDWYKDYSNIATINKLTSCETFCINILYNTEKLFQCFMVSFWIFNMMFDRHITICFKDSFVNTGQFV